ncbi:MAG: glycosyltransferase family 4 protein [Clostridia bacterium]|nr:glycosyltransferase family 4 protein [Clostridia bacterium]
MKALFCYDGPIQYDEGGKHYSPVINNTVFARYLGHAEHLTVAIRVEPFKKAEDAKRSKLIDESDVDIVSVPNLSTAKGIIFDRAKARKIIAAEMEKVDFAIIRLPSFIGAQAVKVAKKLKKPYLVEIVGCPWDSLWNYGLKGKIIAPFMTLSMKSQVNGADYAIYVTNSFLQNRYPTKGVNTNCSNVEIDTVSEEILEKRIEKIRADKEKIILGTTAAVNVPYKGQQYVIEALGKLKKEGITNFVYQMVGDGSRERLEKVIEENDVADQVEFMGVMTHDKVFAWLDTIDIYVQPSRQEGLPRALIEAMSRGLPAIGAKTGGIPELILPECIFSNTSSNIDEICALLKSYDTERMEKESRRNHEESKIYLINNIKKRRNDLLDTLVSKVRGES